MTHRLTFRRAAYASAAIALITLTACASDDKASSATVAAPSGRDQQRGYQPVGGITAPAETAGSEPSPAAPLPALDSRQLVITMTVGVEVKTAATAVDQVIALAQAHGGQLYNSSLDLTDPATAAGDLVFKMPPDQVDAFLLGLEPGIGRRTGLQGTTSDVTAQLTDLDAQILTAKASVERVRALLTDAKDLRDVITLEGELSTRETKLEQLLAQQANISGLVAQATITVHLTTAAAELTNQKKENGIKDAFRSGWKAFVGVLRDIVRLVGYAAPFLIMGGLLLLVTMRISRRYPRSRSVAPQPQPAPDAGPHTS